MTWDRFIIIGMGADLILLSFVVMSLHHRINALYNTIARMRCEEPSMNEVKIDALSEQDLYYLKSIRRQLEEVHKTMESGPTLGGEVLANNCDWLDCFIDKHEKLRT